MSDSEKYIGTLTPYDAERCTTEAARPVNRPLSARQHDRLWRAACVVLPDDTARQGSVEP
jgi:hypothetical protein